MIGTFAAGVITGAVIAITAVLFALAWAIAEWGRDP